MSRLNICGFEGKSPTAESWSSGGTALSVQSTTKFSGDFALQAGNGVSTALENFVEFRGQFSGQIGNFVAETSFNADNTYFKFRFLWKVKPASGAITIYRPFAGGSAKAFLRFRSDGKLELQNFLGSSQGIGATVLAQDSWYTIEVRIPTGSGNNPYEVRINGNTELSGVGSFGSSQHTTAYLGKVGNDTATYELYFDDVAIDDAAFPGNTAITAMRLDGAGFYSQWTGTFDLMNDWTTGADDGDTTRITSTTVGQKWSGTLSPFLGGVVLNVKLHAALRVQSAGAARARLFIRSGSSEAQSINGLPAAIYTPHWGFYSTTDPATGLAWTQAGLDALQAGVLVDAGSTTWSCTAMMVLVETDATIQDAEAIMPATASLDATAENYLPARPPFVAVRARTFESREPRTSDMNTKVDERTFKYFEEEYKITWDFTKRLEGLQALSTGTVTVKDALGNDVTSQLVDSTTVVIVNNTVSVTLKDNGGTRGQFYYVEFLVVTTNPAEVLGQLLELEVR